MPISRLSLVAAVSVVVCLACGGQESAKPESTASIPFQSGGFVPESGVVDRRDFRAVPPENPAMWLPLPAVLEEEGRGPADRWPSTDVTRSTTGSLELDRSGVYVIPWVVPKDADEISIAARTAGAVSAALRVFVLDETGQPLGLLSSRLPAGDAYSESVSVRALRGRRVALCLEVEIAGGGGRLEIGELRLSHGDSERAVSVPTPPPASDGQLPDVVLIILDAARGDRFPGWDYPHETMPAIDELSRNALSFRHAFSECPTTSCSIPALITGIPFLPGGEVGKGQQLSDEITTLAEYLQRLGYHTVGFSATPNNSAAQNLDQGFAEFRELWGRDSPDHGPFNMSRLAAEVIRNQAAGQPLFLQLHYLPPHQPYDPGEEFDRFTDPDYKGPIWPGMSLKPYSLGLETLEGADLDHLIGLYDGNLLVADAAVARVLEVLKDVGRFDDALIIITSDHGEAFMEHGRQGHNTTLYDEMLHVPLIVRLPGNRAPESIDTLRQASVLDVVPTILGYLGSPPDDRVGGLDLLERVLNGEPARLLFFRTSHPRNFMVAARTPTWKLISWPRHQVQMLFRLDEDPGESENLVGEQPYLYANLGLLLRRHLIETSARQLAGEELELTDEAAEALRALGYLN